MDFSSKLLENAVHEISLLPGIGKRTALRLALHLLKQPKENTHLLSNSLKELRDGVIFCSFSEVHLQGNAFIDLGTLLGSLWLHFGMLVDHIWARLRRARCSWRDRPDAWQPMLDSGRCGETLPRSVQHGQ